MTGSQDPQETAAAHDNHALKRASPANIPEISIQTLPSHIREIIQAGERVYYAASPIRRAGGIGVWLIMGAGLAYLPASVGALLDSFQRFGSSQTSTTSSLSFMLIVLGCLFFIAFSLMLAFWPILSELHRRSSFILITNQNVYKIVRWRRRNRMKSWPVGSCNEPSVARRRGQSASLVLRENLHHRKSDDKVIYKWVALHGLPRADEALAALLHARHEALAHVRNQSAN